MIMKTIHKPAISNTMWCKSKLITEPKYIQISVFAFETGTFPAGFIQWIILAITNIT
jgi:hypothetical protein